MSARILAQARMVLETADAPLAALMAMAATLACALQYRSAVRLEFDGARATRPWCAIAQTRSAGGWTRETASKPHVLPDDAAHELVGLLVEELAEWERLEAQQDEDDARHEARREPVL